MEESINLLPMLREAFGCEKPDIRTFSPLAFAYIGDCIFDLVIRTIIVERGNRSSESFHKEATKMVSAVSQSAMIQALTEELTEEEAEMYKKGRNAKTYSQAKNATSSEYKRATGMETLIGYLYLTDRLPRAVELIRMGLEKTGRSI